jgi:hypothetical protein
MKCAADSAGKARCSPDRGTPYRNCFRQKVAVTTFPSASTSGHPSDRRQTRADQDHGPEGREAPSLATRRPQAGALLTVILVGSRLERREDGRTTLTQACSATVTSADEGRAVPGGSARAAARRAPQGAKAELPVRVAVSFPQAPRPARAPRPSHCPAGTCVTSHGITRRWRAARAFKGVKIVLTTSDNVRCRRLSAESFRWSRSQCATLAIIRASATPVYEFP